jgi:hypothetical protein
MRLISILSLLCAGTKITYDIDIITHPNCPSAQQFPVRDTTDTACGHAITGRAFARRLTIHAITTTMVVFDANRDGGDIDVV